MNRIIGNVLVVDSAMGNALVLTSANTPVHFGKYRAQTIFLSMLDSTAAVTFTQADTTIGIIHLNKNWAAVDFPMGMNIDSLKVPTLTNGTAWIYLA